jgi:outer membrane protein OmpA-like peptidoglycan-associated protein
MKRVLAFLALLAACAVAQDSAPQASPSIEPMDQIPVYRVNVVSRTTRAVNYRHRGGSTTVDMRGTDLMPAIKGRAKVDGKEGRLAVDVQLSNLEPATKFGGQYLTYVLWAVTPEGRAVNLGEVVPNTEGKSSLNVTTDLQAFGLIVTAEPYFAVTRPSNKEVAENIIRQETKGFEQPMDAKFDTLEGGQYTIDVPVSQLPSTTADPKTPLDLLEARNAVAIAKAAGAETYAADSLRKAEDFLTRAEDYFVRKQGRTPIGTAARGATQMAEDARVLTLQRKERERIATEKRIQEERRAKAEADAKAASEAEAAAKEQSEEDLRRRRQAEADQKQAEADRQAAERAQADAQRAQAEADAARASAQAEAEKQRLAADEAIRQKEAMRDRLLKQLNQVLETKDSPRGLIVSMPDVLFDTAQYTLKPAARERLARISGIVLAYPDLKLEVEGHTDSTGSHEFNQRLSEKRAASVRDYLVDANVPVNNVVARGLAETDPVADNKTAAGRKLNRRVEMIVSGDVIGTIVGHDGPPPPPPPTEQQ